MPKPKQHQEKADHHRAFLATIAADQFPDWAAVVAFYCAVELIEKLRAYDGQHSESHHDRNVYVQQKPHRQIHVHFRELYTAALVARYATLNAFAHSAQQVRDELVNKHLAAIEGYVRQLSAAKSAPPAP